MKRTVLFFGLLSLGVALFFRFSIYTVYLGGLGLEIILACVALLFFVLGAWLFSKKGQAFLYTVKTRPSNPKELEQLGLTNREREVFLEICRGLSNREIAEKLYVSEHTVKTHVSNLLMKLEVKRRTQVIRLARELGVV